MAVASLQFPALAQVGNFRRVRKIGNAIYGEAKAGEQNTTEGTCRFVGAIQHYFIKSIY